MFFYDGIHCLWEMTEGNGREFLQGNRKMNGKKWTEKKCERTRKHSEMVRFLLERLFVEEDIPGELPIGNRERKR
jgi:hypothetical protein